MINFDEALKILDSIKLKVQPESVPVLDALHRITYHDELSKLDFPTEDNSAMDGYALQSSHTGSASSKNLKLEIEKDTVYAGDGSKKYIQPNRAVKIMTGGYLPDNLDAVIPFEDARVADGNLIVTSPVMANKNVRKKGEDINNGDKILDKNRILTAESIALLISCNIKKVEVYENIPISIISTGNEILNANQRYQYGKVFNSNGILAELLLSQSGCKIIKNTICKDNLSIIKKTIKSALKNSKIIITSAGASFGEKDFTEQALVDLGLKIKFRQVAIKPAKPFSFGVINDIPVFMIPGNPIAFFTCLIVFLKPFLENRLGINPNKRIIKSISSFKYTKKHKRREFIPAYTYSKEGCFYSEAYKRFGPAMISALGHINSLVSVPENTPEIGIGDYIEVHFIHPYAF